MVSNSRLTQACERNRLQRCNWLLSWVFALGILRSHLGALPPSPRSIGEVVSSGVLLTFPLRSHYAQSELRSDNTLKKTPPAPQEEGGGGRICFFCLITSEGGTPQEEGGGESAHIKGELASNLIVLIYYLSASTCDCPRSA